MDTDDPRYRPDPPDQADPHHDHDDLLPEPPLVRKPDPTRHFWDLLKVRRPAGVLPFRRKT